MSRPILSLIAAVARNGVIGRDNQMPWRLPEDARFLKRTTLGHSVIMGRKTWDSLPPRFRPLPERDNIVVTRNASWQADGAHVASSLPAALGLVPPGTPRVFVIGGSELYRLALPLADELVLTEIERDFDGDAVFPAWNRAEFVETSREPHVAEAPNDFAFSFAVYRRARPAA